MKKILLLSILCLLLTSCFGVKQIGDVNIISNRNVELTGGNYELIRTYAGSSSKKELKKEFKRVKAKNIDQALSHVLRNTPGGEFVSNAKIYLLNGTYYVIQGDIWGVKGANIDHKGFSVGDKVQYNRAMKRRTGVIVDLKDSEHATVKEDETDGYYPIKYDRLLKISSGQ